MVRMPLTLRRHRVGQVGIIVAVACLIVLTWIGTYSAIEAERRAARSQVEANAWDQAFAIGERFSVQMLGYERTVRVIERQWERDPDPFSFKELLDPAAVMNDPSLDLFVTDAAGVIRASTNPDLVGKDLSDREFFMHEANVPDDGDRLGVDRSGRGVVPDQWSITMVRRLDDPAGRFRGIIGISFNSAPIADYFRRVHAGKDAIMLVVGKAGMLRAVSGTIQARPGQSIASSELFQQASVSGGRSWVGPTAPDGVTRIHGFYRLPNRNLIVIVGYDWQEAMRASDAWRRGAAVFALGITVFLILIAALMLRDLKEGRLREQRMARSRSALESAYAQLKAAKAQTDAKSGQLEATFASMSDGVSLLDADLRVVQWNERFCNLTGLPPADLRVGWPFRDLLRRQAELGEFGAVDPAAEVERRMALLVSHSRPVVTERVRPNGMTIELRRAPLPAGGFVTLVSDITARKEAEAAQSRARAAAEAAAEEKSRFAAIVSHEIRTPLNMLLNSVEILAQSDLAPQGREVVGLAQQAGQALHGLLNDILELSKLEAGRLSLRPAWFDVEALLAGVLDLFRLQVTEPGATFSLELDSGVPGRIYADPIRLRQILMNFVSNAVKFSDPGEIRLCARLEGEDQTGWFLRVAVIDPGPRIAEADRERLFQAFSRLDHPGSQNKPGSGLGLAICRRLVELVGGEIGCDASEGRGNSFWLRLPIPAPLADPAGTDASPDAAPLRVLPRTRILLVDDVISNQTIAAMLLGRAGHAVDKARSGADAIAAASRTPYDIVLLDLSMPGMDGFETAARLRALGGPAAETPIVALTAHVDENARARCLASGMQDVLAKPVDARALLEAIHRLVWVPSPHAAPEVLQEQAPVPEAPALCLDRLSMLRETMPDAAIGRMFETCLSDLNDKQRLLGEALAGGDDDQAARELHAMTGVAASYGLAELEARLRSVRVALNRGDSVDATLGVAEIGRDLARAAAAVRDAFTPESVS